MMICRARRTLGRARSLCAVKLKMSWRAAVARHTCTTHRNRAPCEEDQNCAWVNPHPRGARFKHKLLNFFTRDVEDPGGRCEFKRASHARHASPSDSSSETDLSSEPESFSPTTSDFKEESSDLSSHAGVSPRSSAGRAGLEPTEDGSPRRAHSPERRSELPDGERSNRAESQVSAGPLAKPHSPLREAVANQAPLSRDADSESESSDEESHASARAPQHYEKSVSQRKAEREEEARRLAQSKRDEGLRKEMLKTERPSAKKWGKVATNYGPQKATVQQQSSSEENQQEHALHQAAVAEARRLNVAAARGALQARLATSVAR